MWHELHHIVVHLIPFVPSHLPQSAAAADHEALTVFNECC